MSGDAERWKKDWSRRELLYRAGVGGLALGGAGLLAACDSGGSDSASTGAAGSPASGTPKKGGTLRVGIVGGTNKDLLDPHNGLSEAVYPRTLNLFDLPGYRDPSSYKPQFRLVESAEPNKAGDQWVVRLRDGVEFHNGKTLDADDLIFTINRILDPKAPTLSAGSFQYMGIKRMKKEDKRTVRFVMSKPFGPFVDSLFNPYAAIVPVGFDPQNPVGTGPFKYKSFTPAQESVFEAFENYWGDGPYVDELVLQDFIDDTARVNALLGGQVDAIDGVPPSQIQVIQGRSGFKVLDSETGNLRLLTMRVDKPPFDDVNVRQAMRLLVDREQMVNSAYAGHARVASDVFSPYDSCYSTEFNREQDLDQAKSLLKKAGAENLSVELVTSPVAAGLVEVAQVFAQQAKAAGVNVQVKKSDPSEFYARQYLTVPFSVDWWPTYPYVNTAAQALLPGGVFNATHQADPEYNSKFAKAVQELDEGKRCAQIGELQRLDFERGGNIIWGFVNTVDAYSDKITGFYPDKNGWHLSTYDFKAVSFV